MDAAAFVARILRRPGVVAARSVFGAYNQAAGGLLANGLAFSALFAAIPTTLLVLGVASWVAAGDPTIRERVIDALVAGLPPLADLLRGSVEAVSEQAALTSLVGVAGLLWTVSHLFRALDVAFARIFSDGPERGGVRRTVRGFVVIGLAAALVAAIVAGLGLIAVLDAGGGSTGYPALGAAELIGSPLFLGLMAVVVVIACYREFPPLRPSWGAVLAPALMVSLLEVALSQAFTFLVPRLVVMAELAGSLASGFVALAWLSLSFEALLLGAAWVRVRESIGSAP